jgi:hypothetical protein
MLDLIELLALLPFRGEGEVELMPQYDEDYQVVEQNLEA